MVLVLLKKSFHESIEKELYTLIFLINGKICV